MMLSIANTENMLITQEQSLKACKLLSEVTVNLKASMEGVKSLTQLVKDGEFQSKKGLSLLDLKNNTFLSYMSNLMFSTLLKLSGESLNRHPVIDRLIEQRVVFERLGPYENKLKYKIEECLKVENEGSSAPHPEEAEDRVDSKGLSTEDFAAGDTDAEDEQTDDEGEASGQLSTNREGVRTYRVPKVSQNKFPEERDTEEKALAARRRLLNSAMMQDALYEHSQDPDVIHHSSALQRKAIKKREEITKFEEDNLKRVRLSKRDRSELRATSTAGAMSGELLGFSDVSGLTEGGSGGFDDKPSKKRRTSGGAKSKGKKKGGKKRR